MLQRYRQLNPVVARLERTVCGDVITTDLLVRRILTSGHRYGCVVKCASDGRYGCVRDVKIKRLEFVNS